MRQVPPATKREKLAWEKELLGLYVSEHPFKEYGDFFGNLLVPVAKLAEHKGQRGLLRLGGSVTSVRQIVTKKNEPMAFVRLEDVSGTVEIVVFPSVFKECGAVLTDGAAVLVEGKYSEKDGETKILCEKATAITPKTAEDLRGKLAYASSLSGGPAWDGSRRALSSDSAEVRLAVPGTMTQTFASELKRVFADHPGSRRVVLVVKSGQETRKIATSFAIDLSSETIAEIEAVLGRGAVLS